MYDKYLYYHQISHTNTVPETKNLHGKISIDPLQLILPVVYQSYKIKNNTSQQLNFFSYIFLVKTTDRKGHLKQHWARHPLSVVWISEQKGNDGTIASSNVLVYLLEIILNLSLFLLSDIENSTKSIWIEDLGRLLPFIFYLFQLEKIMNELVEILTTKLNLINAKKDYKSMTVAEKDALLDQLMIEKRKQSLRTLVESRLQQALATRHVVADQEIKDIISQSLQIMKIHLPDLQAKESQKPLDQMVTLYCDFFSKVGCSQRVKEIENVHEKRLCPKSMVPSTLFNWFVQWTRKQFSEYLKTTIHSLYVNSRQPIHSIHREQKNKDIKEEEQNTPQDKEGDPFLIIHRKSIIQEKNDREKERREIKELPKSFQDLRIGSPLNGFLKKLEKPQGTIEENGPINRQIFLFAFADEFQTLYKSLEDCLSDLEGSWARRLKRGSRKQQVLRRLSQVASSCIKQMPWIKMSIDSYNQLYKNSHWSKLKPPKSPRTEPALEINYNSSGTSQVLKRKKKKRIELQSQELTQRVSKKRQITNQDKLLQAEVKTAEGERLIATTDRKIVDRRLQLVQSLRRKQRYDLDSEYGSESNLLPSSSHKKRQQISLEMSHKTIDFNSNQQTRQSRLLWLNSSYNTNQLEIIQQRVKKMKIKVMHGRPLRGSVSKQKKKSKITKSLDLKEGNSIQYRSISIELQTEDKQSFKLPKIKRKR